MQNIVEAYMGVIRKPIRTAVSLLTAALIGISSIQSPVAQAKDTPPPQTNVHWGDYVPEGFAPYVVSLHSYKEDGVYSPQTQFCGGALIAADKVITAKHCVDYSPEKIVINAGSVYLTKQTASSKIKNITTFQYTLTSENRSYENTSYFDLVLLDLQTPLSGENIKPIRFGITPDSSPIWALTMGWGIDERGMSSNQLKEIPIPILSPAQSARFANYFTPESRIFAFLAGGNGKQDTCYGDSGTPIVTYTADPAFPSEQRSIRLAGVVSAGLPGYGCGKDGIPGIYARIDPNIYAYLMTKVNPDPTIIFTGNERTFGQLPIFEEFPSAVFTGTISSLRIQTVPINRDYGRTQNSVWIPIVNN